MATIVSQECVGVYMQAMIARCVFVRICISLLDAYSYAYAYGTVRQADGPWLEVSFG